MATSSFLTDQKMPAPATSPFKVTVLLVTYNHEAYIRQALDSLFGQVIEGPVELVIADDYSSDRTLAIIKKYMGKDERFQFKYLDSTENLGITKNYQRGFAACSGEYVAVLEGDDYWISPFKLQRQNNFLDAHWECDLCSVNFFVFEESRLYFYPRTKVGNGHRLISARNLIADHVASNFSTCMYRKSALDALPEGLFEMVSYDWIVNICIARDSLIGFLEEPMSVYRLHPAGAWTQMPHIQKLAAQLDMIPSYDSLTKYIFHREFEVLSDKLRYMIFMAKLTNVQVLLKQPMTAFASRFVAHLPPQFRRTTAPLVHPIRRFIARFFNRDAT